MFITITRGTLRRIAAGAAVFALVMALFMLLPQRQTAETAAASGNWGLSFQVEGEPPEATSPPASCASGTPIIWATRRENHLPDL